MCCATLLAATGAVRDWRGPHGSTYKPKHPMGCQYHWPAETASAGLISIVTTQVAEAGDDDAAAGKAVAALERSFGALKSE